MKKCLVCPNKIPDEESMCEECLDWFDANEETALQEPRDLTKEIVDKEPPF